MQPNNTRDYAMDGTERKLREIDISRMIAEEGSDGYLIDMDLLAKNIGEAADGLLIRGGLVIILCRSNGGRITVDGKDYSISRNNVIVLPENHIINYVEPPILIEGEMLAVSVDYMLGMPSPIDTSIFAYSRYISVIQVTDDKFSDLHSYYRFIYKESKESGRYQKEIIHSIFYALILKILGEYERLADTERPASIKASSLTDRFFRLLAAHYKQHRSVQYYADSLNLTAKYLSTAVKRTTGRPILEWIHEAVLIDAKMLLRSTDLTVEEISFRLNFANPSAFVQFFKLHIGTTPHRYRVACGH